MNGSREALFALAQTRDRPDAARRHRGLPEPVLSDLRGRGAAGRAPQTAFVNSDPARNFAADWARDRRRHLGAHAAALRLLARQPDRRGDAAGRVAAAVRAERPPRLRHRLRRVLLGDLLPRRAAAGRAARPRSALGRDDFRNLVAFTSLSKRSNVPGLRSGFVAGDAALLKAFLLYRTYHGSAMSPLVQRASIAAWNDEAHVRGQPRRCTARSSRRSRRCWPRCSTSRCPTPASTSGPACPAGRRRRSPSPRPARSIQCRGAARQPAGARRRTARNPGAGRIRMALVAAVDECLEAAQRIVSFTIPLSLAMTHEPHELQNHHRPGLGRPRRASPPSNAPDDARGRRAGHRRPQRRPPARGRAPGRRPVDGQPVGQEGGAAELPPERQPARCAPATWASSTRCRPSSRTSTKTQMRATGVRVVPPAVARRGAYIAKNVVLMPSYVNIGAYVDEGTMVDTWATVGSLRADRQERAPVGRRRHRRRARAAAGQPDHHRGQLLHRRALARSSRA